MFSLITSVVFYVVLGWVGYKASGKEEVTCGYNQLNKDIGLPNPFKLVITLLALSLILIIAGAVATCTYVSEKIIDFIYWLRKVTVKA